MRIFQKILTYAFIFGIIAFSGYFLYQNSLSPCDRPLKYGLGRFDTQFGISKEEFKTYVAESEKVWEKALGKDLFIYDAKADFKINLIYDERQLATVQKQKTEFGLSAVEDVFKKLDTEFSTFKNKYDQKISLYEKALNLYKSRKSAYEEKVSFENSRGGASKTEYQSLEAERKYLNSEAERLNAEAATINTATRQLNILLEERNAKAVEYNKIAAEYNKKYNGGLEFNQAEYIGGGTGLNATSGQINVYQFGNKKDLIFAVTHEFGHALGLDHVENPYSIMYYISGSNIQSSPTLSSEDLTELNRVCK